MMSIFYSSQGAPRGSDQDNSELWDLNTANLLMNMLANFHGHLERKTIHTLIQLWTL